MCDTKLSLLSVMDVMDKTLITSHFSNNKILLNSEKGYDVKIRIGVEFDVKELHAHSSILCAQCPFFRDALTDLTKENGYYIIRISNISERIFKPILK